MNQIKIVFSVHLMVFTLTTFAQKKTFDIVTYTAPKNWTEQKGNGSISYSRIDGASWAQIAIYEHRNSEGDIQSDFDKDWKELVAGDRTISSQEKTKPQTEEGWTVMSGSGVWQYNGTNVASILTVYSNKKSCVAVLCNSTAQPYLKEYQTLISTIDLKTVANAFELENESQANTNTTSPKSDKTINSSVLGLWVFYNTETNGNYAQLTGGYMRREYVFKADGTYTFRAKDWMVFVKNIFFAYESGTYKIDGNKITITPKKGKGEWWSKTPDGRTEGWGKFVKSADYKLESITYTFELFHVSDENKNKIILTSSKPTSREGSKGNTNEHDFHYESYDSNKSLIDNPPTFKNK